MQTEILGPDPKSLQKAADLLLAGEVAAIPTETVYGLAAHGLNTSAVRKIFTAKGRPSTDPLILHLPSPDLKTALNAGFVAEPIPEVAYQLASAFWPGPLTLILPKGPKVPVEVTSGLPSVAVRYPAHPVTQKLLSIVNVPLAAPSANRFGRISPTDAQAVLEELDGRIPLILDGGSCATGVESTVLSLMTSEPTILRPGKITAEQLGRVLGNIPRILSAKSNAGQPMPSPGMLESHYAPSTPLYLVDQPIAHCPTGILYIHYTSNDTPLAPNRLVLTPAGDPVTAAQNLYRILRRADAQGAPAILIEPIPDSAWAPALRDRILRASSGTASWDGNSWNLHPKKNFT